MGFSNLGILYLFAHYFLEVFAQFMSKLTQTTDKAHMSYYLVSFNTNVMYLMLLRALF